MPGIEFGIYFSSLGRVGHCGIIERMQGDFIVSIEGNTGADDSRRNGDGIYRRMRHRRTICKYADWLSDFVNSSGVISSK